MTFSEETSTSQRVETLGYAPANGVRQGYTGYQKDDESGLDFAQARYYNSAHGRFTSVDPLTASANLKNPQTFNRYSYVLNSPYKYTDPLGLISEYSGSACGNRCLNSDGGFGGGMVSAYSGMTVDTIYQLDRQTVESLLAQQNENPSVSLPSGLKKDVTAATEEITGTVGGETFKKGDFIMGRAAKNRLGIDGEWVFGRAIEEATRFEQAMKELDYFEKEIQNFMVNPLLRIDRSGFKVGQPIYFTPSELQTNVGVNIGEIIQLNVVIARAYHITSERVSVYNDTIANTEVGLKIRKTAFANTPANSVSTLITTLPERPRIKFRRGENSLVGSTLEQTFERRMKLVRAAGHNR